MNHTPPGLPDSAFFRANVPMTKQEVRAITFAKAQIQPHFRVLDIGGGTGSLSIEAALLAHQGEVVAIEKDERAWPVFRENVQKFSVNNIILIEGSAPKSLKGLGKFDCVLIGGSGDELGGILSALPNLLKPGSRVVANAICLETIWEIQRVFQHAPFANWDVTHIQLSRGTLAGNKTRYAPMSPTWIASAEFQPELATSKIGKIVGIGVGPGAPDLLTQRAIAAIQQCDVVAAPRASEDSQSLALRIASPHMRPACEVRELHLPMTKDSTVLHASWAKAADELIALAAKGKSVSFLTLGDAMLYSTWGYILREIRRQNPTISVSTIPGITAMSACAAEIGEPLAEGNTPLVVWPGEPNPAINLHNANAVFMKASQHLRNIQNIASENNLRCVTVRNCTLPNQQITTQPIEWENESQYFTTALCLKSHSENS